MASTLHEYKYIFLIITLSILLRMRNISSKFVVNIKTHILWSVPFLLLKSDQTWDNMEIYCKSGQATDGNMAHAHFMLDTIGYKPTLTICNIYCFRLRHWSHEYAVMLVHSALRVLLKCKFKIWKGN